jgi:hypothetical protein
MRIPFIETDAYPIHRRFLVINSRRWPDVERVRFDAFSELRVCIEKKSYPGSNFSLHHYGKQLPAHTAEFQILTR